MASLHLFDSNDYYQTLIRDIPKAKHRIVLAAMVVLWGGKTEPVFEALLAAAKRGVKVTVLLDIFTAATIINGAKHGRQRWQKTNSLLQELHSLGATIYRVGQMGVNPYRGRCHIKITIVDDIVYSFGGINFSDEQLVITDYMLHAQDAPYADCLAELVDRIGHSKGALPNGEEILDAQHTVLFDGGGLKDSVIYDKACELAAQAKRVYYVSQMAPSGELAKLLAETATVYYTNRPDQMRGPAALAQAFDLQRLRIPNSYTRSRFIHAKFILFELGGGRKALVSGSNNFSYRGVAYGTKEVALYSTDKTLWQELYDYMEAEIIDGRARQEP
jgi:hypothetical protein